MLIFVYAGPLLFNIATSLTNWTGLGWNMKFVGLTNYLNMFKENEILTTLLNNVKFLIGTLVLQNVLAIWLSTWLARKFRGQNFFRSLIFMPAVFPVVVVAMVFGVILDPNNGPIATYAQMLHWDWLANIKFLGDPKLVMYTLIAVNVWQWTGWNMVIYIAGHQSIPLELYESSAIDGASGWQNFRHITLPMLAPTITINVVLTTMGALRVYDLPYAMTRGGPGYASESMVMAIVHTSFSANRAGMAAALSILLAVLTLCVTFIQSYFLTKREEAMR